VRRQLILLCFFFQTTNIEKQRNYSEWTSTDSLYGSRHLANKWKEENFLDKIKVLALFDLMG
jgi:hypothetical protein